MTYEIEIGRGKRGRRAYSLDDVAVVPSRLTRDPLDVSVTWQIDAYQFEMPVVAAPMDSAMSPATVIAMGRNSSTLTRLASTLASTNRLTTIPISTTLETNTAALRAAAPSGFSAYLDLSPPAAKGNTYSQAAISLLGYGGRVAMMGSFYDGMWLPGELMVRRNLRVFGYG